MTPAVQAYLYCMLVVVFYSGNILTGKALEHLPPLTIAFTRLAIAAAVLLPLGYRSAWRSRSVFRRHLGALLLLTVSGVTFFNTFIYTALQFTSASNVSVLEAAIPALTAVLSAWLLRERLRPLQWFGIALSLFGAMWVVTDGSLHRMTAMGWNVGDAVMVGAIVSWAVYSVAVKRYLHLFPHYGAVLVMTALSVVILAPLVLAEWVVTGPPPLTPGPHWWGLLYLGVFPSVVALLLYNRAVGVLGASRASVFLNLLPVFTMAGAYLLLGEHVSSAQVLGAAVVIAGVSLTTGAWSLLAGRRAEPGRG